MAKNEFQIKVETTCGKTFVEDVRDLPTEVLGSCSKTTKATNVLSHMNSRQFLTSWKLGGPASM